MLVLSGLPVMSLGGRYHEMGYRIGTRCGLEMLVLGGHIKWFVCAKIVSNWLTASKLRCLGCTGEIQL